MKNVFGTLISRLDTPEASNWIEDVSAETSQTESNQKREKKKKKRLKNKSAKEQWGDYKRYNVSVIKVPEGDYLSLKMIVLVAQSCPTLRNPIDWSRPGSSVHEILQTRIVE